MRHRTLPLYQIDAFTGKLFRGNPAAVVPLPAPIWPSDRLLQAIAAENNLAETAFLYGGTGRYALRWFTPVREVDLCGHATLAAAFVVFRDLEPGLRTVCFDGRSGPLTVVRDGDELMLDFPAVPAERIIPPPPLVAGLNNSRFETLAATDYMAVLATEKQVRDLSPDMTALGGLDRRGVIVTAPGDECDFVSRFFAPTYGIPEDPVTGSAHCTLAPFWAERLGKSLLTARQLSARGGELRCAAMGDRVHLWGNAVLYLEGRIHLG